MLNGPTPAIVESVSNHNLTLDGLVAQGTHIVGGGLSHTFIPRQNFVFSNIKAILLVKYYAVASISILYFDYIITLPTEIRRIWIPVFRRGSDGFTGATFLFVLNRYVPMVAYVPVMISLFNPPWSIESCNKFAPYVGAVSAFGQFIIATILVLRTYALYNRNLWILLLTGMVGVVCVAIGAYGVSSVRGNLFSFKPFVMCMPILTIRVQGRLKYAWISIFLFDFLIFVLTLARTYALTATQTSIVRSSVVMLVMRDGAAYFLVMSVVNAVNYVLFVSLNNSFFTSSTGTTSILAHIISVTLMSHLLLNLRQDHTRPLRDNDLTAAQNTSGIGRFRKYALGLGGRIGGGTTFFESREDGGNTTGTGLVFTTRILGNLTAELREDGAWDEEEWREVTEDGRRSGRRRRWSRSRSGTSESVSGYESGGAEGSSVVEEMELQERVRSGDPGLSRGGSLARETDLSVNTQSLPRGHIYVHVGSSSQPQSPETLRSPSSTLVAISPQSLRASSGSIAALIPTRENVSQREFEEGSSGLQHRST